MGLREVISAGREVTVKGHSIKVNGLSLYHLSRLVVEHGDALASIMGGKLSMANVYHDAPKFVADVIAWGTGALDENFQEQSGLAAQLGIIDQMNLVEAVWDETVPSEEELKKLLGRVESMLPGLVQHLGSE